MSDRIIDLTIPAHDPNFPKPRGLIPVPPEVAEWVADLEARVFRELGGPLDPEARQRILDDWTLYYYYDDTYITTDGRWWFHSRRLVAITAPQGDFGVDAAAAAAG